MNDMIAETVDLLAMKRRLERAVFTDNLALLIITNNLNCRETREGLDRCQDDVELNLIKVTSAAVVGNGFPDNAISHHIVFIISVS